MKTYGWNEEFLLLHPLHWPVQTMSCLHMQALFTSMMDNGCDIDDVTFSFALPCTEAFVNDEQSFLHDGIIKFLTISDMTSLDFQYIRLPSMPRNLNKWQLLELNKMMSVGLVCDWLQNAKRNLCHGDAICMCDTCLDILRRESCIKSKLDLLVALGMQHFSQK